MSRTFLAICSTVLVTLSCAAASQAAADVRVSWTFNGINGAQPDAYNDLKGGFTNQTQTAGDNAANLHDAVPAYPSTGVGVTWAGWRRYNSNPPAAFGTSRDWVDKTETYSQLAGADDAASTTASVTFTGLVTGNAYQVEVVMTGISGSAWDVTIGGNDANHSFLNTAGQNAAVGAWNPQSNGSAQSDWLVWDAVTASGGALTIDFFKGVAGGTDGLHAIRITGVVPEPGSIALLGLGGLTLLRRQRTR